MKKILIALAAFAGVAVASSALAGGNIEAGAPIAVAQRHHCLTTVAGFAVNMFEQMQRQGTAAVEQIDIGRLQVQKFVPAECFGEGRQPHPQARIECGVLGKQHRRFQGRLLQLLVGIGQKRAENLAGHIHLRLPPVPAVCAFWAR